MSLFVIGALIVIIQASYAAKNETLCGQPLITGYCKAYMPSFGYNGQECVSFVYGGCGGNDNRFQTKEECERSCKGVIIPCDGYIACGPCQKCGKVWSGSCADEKECKQTEACIKTC